MKKNISWAIIIALFIKAIIPLSNVVQAATFKEKTLSNNEIITNPPEDKRSLSIKEDVDINGVIDILDLALTSNKYNINKNNPLYEKRLDINEDDIIDIYDLVLVSNKINNFANLLSGIHEENNTLIKYVGSWNEDYNEMHGGGTIKYSYNKGDYIEVSFYGTGIEIYSLHDIDYGIATIYIDDEEISKKDLYLWKPYYNKYIYANNNLELGEHILKIEVTGEKRESSKGNKVSIDRIAVNNQGINLPTYRVYQYNGKADNYIGQYDTLEAAIREASLYTVTHIKDKEGNQVWTNSYAVYQGTKTGVQILVGKFKTLDEAKVSALNFKNSYILDLEGKEIWRGKYEVFSSEAFVGRYNTLEEAQNIAKSKDDAVIKEVLNNDNILWNNKYTVYQIIQANQYVYKVKEFTKLGDAKTEASKYNNTHITNGLNEEIWTNGYKVVLNNSEENNTYIGRYETLNEAINIAKTKKLASVIDPSGKEIWKGRYEVYQNTNYLFTFSTLDESQSYAVDFENTKIINLETGANVWNQTKVRRMYSNINDLNLREQESSESTSLDKMNINAEVKVIDTSNSYWYKVKYNGKIGYVNSSYLSNDKIEINQATNWTLPVSSNYRLTQSFGNYWSENGYHLGIDVVTTDRLIYAASNGVVVEATPTSLSGGNGNCILIEHTLANGKKIYSIYSHLESIQVSVGTVVKAGQKIGVMGTTGYSTGIHLHFAITDTRTKKPSGYNKTTGVSNGIGVDRYSRKFYDPLLTIKNNGNNIK